MTSKKPYLIRALYEWIADNDATPYLMVNATLPNVVVPQKYVKEGVIILNISPFAAKDLKITNEEIVFESKFEGRTFEISFPLGALISIFARETGRGMIFAPNLDKQMGVNLAPKPKNTKPHLTLIKNTD